MRNTLTALATSLLLLATHANADQQTVDAIQKEGGTLTNQEIFALKDIQCKKPNPEEKFIVSDSCQSLIDSIADLVAKYSDNEEMITAILTGAIDAHPELSQQLADAAMAASPDNIAQIAALMIELAPTAAGVPQSITPTGNIPTTSDGGGGITVAPTGTGGGTSSSPS